MFFFLSGDVKFVYQFLQKLTVVDRFDMTLMFLSKPEKQGIVANLVNGQSPNVID